MVAFATEHLTEGQKDDPRFTQWIVSLENTTDGVKTQTRYPVHQCSDEEFDRFHRIEAESRIKVAQLQAAGQFKCFDWQKEDMNVYGSWRSDANW